MSRNINVPVRSNSGLAELQNTNNGKLIFTSLRGRKMALLIQNNRLTAAQVLQDTVSDAIDAVYIGRVQNFSPNLKAYFVEIEKNFMCFLPETELCPGQTAKAGDELPVQIIREPQKTKLATVTTRISISNDYAAVSLGHPGIGYSGKLQKSQKEEIRNWLQESGIISLVLDNPQIGLVIRTKAGECKNDAQKALFLNNVRELLDEFREMLQLAEHRTCYSCIRRPRSVYESIWKKFIKHEEFLEIITDEPEIWEKLNELRNENKIDSTAPLRLYQDNDFPLEKVYALETKLKTAIERRVWLKSGGYLIIDPTEALTVIDVNSGKYEVSKRKETEEMIMQVNREAAEEVALQLRLRNLSGIIIVDFINMKKAEDQKTILELLTGLVSRDKTPTNIVDITPLGLVEITRQKIYKTLNEQLHGE